MPTPLDPICLVHGQRKSEHVCLYCCLCFKPLTPTECHQLPDGTQEDVCEECAAREAEEMRKRELSRQVV